MKKLLIAIIACVLIPGTPRVVPVIPKPGTATTEMLDMGTYYKIRHIDGKTYTIRKGEK